MYKVPHFLSGHIVCSSASTLILFPGPQIPKLELVLIASTEDGLFRAAAAGMSPREARDCLEAVTVHRAAKPGSSEDSDDFLGVPMEACALAAANYVFIWSLWFWSCPIVAHSILVPHWNKLEKTLLYQVPLA